MMTRRERAERKAQREASKAELERLRALARVIVASGECPHCGQGLRRNLSIAGWWQCVGFGAKGFRAADTKPCGFQTFTE